MGQHLSISYKLSSDQGCVWVIELRGLMQSLGDLRQLVGLKTPAIIELLGSNPGDNINWVWYLFGSKNAGHSSGKLLPMIVERVVFKYSHGPLAKCKDIPPAHEVLVRPASLEVTAKDTQRLKDWVHLSKKGCGEDFVFWIRRNPKTLPEEVAKRDQLFDTLGKLSVYDRLVDLGSAHYASGHQRLFRTNAASPFRAWIAIAARPDRSGFPAVGSHVVVVAIRVPQPAQAATLQAAFAVARMAAMPA